MVRRAGVPQSEDSSRDGGAASGISGACKRGLQVFGAFVVVAAAFFVLTFGPFKTIDGIKDLPLPTWIMILPTLATLGAGVITGLIVMMVNLIRGRPSHRD